MNLSRKKVFVSLMFFLVFLVSTNAFASTTNELKIVAGNSVSGDENGYMSLSRFTGDIIDNEWVNYLEYDNTENKGSSRLTFKVDKDFISDDDNYYDITIEYFDEGIGVMLLQSSSDENNTINYGVTGYGGYVEESWSWADSYYYANISLNLTNSRQWKTHTFRVTDEFFEDNVDNYIHFYFGRNVNFGDKLRIKSVSLVKRVFKIDSIDKNTADNSPITGNIYSNGTDFGMGVRVFNTSDEAQTFDVNYKILDSKGNVVYEEALGQKTLQSKGEEKIYITEPDKFGVYTLVVEVRNEDGTVEIEEIKFSKMFSDLTNKINRFLGINSFFGYSGWANEKQIKDAVEVGNKIGIGDIRTNINNLFVYIDKLTGYDNEVGRYEYTYDKVLNEYNQDVLFTVHPRSTTYEEMEDEIIEVYKSIARKYGDKLEYYEILNEMNLVGDGFGITPERYAEIVVKASNAIREIDSDAKIVAIVANRVPIYGGDNNTYSLDESWIGKVLKTEVLVDNKYVSPIEVIDAISVHPYSDTYSMSPETSGEFNKLSDLRTFIDEYRNKYSVEKEIPIWITEIGYQESCTGTTEEQQAAYLSRFLILSVANSTNDTLDIEKVYIYCLQDTGFSNAHAEANYGIVDAFKTAIKRGYIRDVEMAAKDGYIALNMYGNMLDGAVVLESNQETVSQDGFYCYKFKASNEQDIVMALWNDNEDVESVSVNVNLPKGQVVVYDMYGNVLNEFINTADSCSMEISYKPIYVVISEDRDIQNAEISYVYEHEYDGYAKEPEVTVALGDKTLEKDVDYVVSYYDNVNIGQGKIKVEGIGNFSGTVEKAFEINSLEPFKFEEDYSLLKYGTTMELKVNRTTGVTWNSSDSAIATINDGVISTNGVGRVTITATYGNTTLTQEIFVWNVRLDSGRFHTYNDIRATRKSNIIMYSGMVLAVEKTSYNTGKILDYTGGRLSKNQSIIGKYLSRSTLSNRHITKCL